MSRYRLGWYELKKSESGDWLVKFPLGDVYSKIIDQAFPKLNHIGWRSSTKSNSYTYIKETNAIEIKQLEKFLDLLKERIVLRLNKNLDCYFKDELDQCFALDYNWEVPDTYTGVGELEYEAKYKKDIESIERLAEILAFFSSEHPNFKEANFITAVPGNPGKSFHLPDFLVKKMGEYMMRDVGLDLRKVKTTPQLKNLSFKDKVEALKDSFSLGENVKNQTVLLIDDLYQSGTTMWTLAKFLKENGAIRVYGLACVKSWRDSDNI